MHEEVKLTVVDLSKESLIIIHNTAAAYIEHVLNQGLLPYFMVTFSYKLKNFGSEEVRAANNLIRHRDDFR